MRVKNWLILYGCVAVFVGLCAWGCWWLSVNDTPAPLKDYSYTYSYSANGYRVTYSYRAEVQP